MTEHNITENITGQDWIAEEKAALGTQTQFEKLPALKLVENEVTEITIDCSKKWEVYNTTDRKDLPVVKAIIPVLHNSERKNFWLNKKNPLYRQLLDVCTGKTTIIVKIMQTGTQADTKYILVK